MASTLPLSLLFSQQVMSNSVNPLIAAHQTSWSLNHLWVCPSSCPLNWWHHSTTLSSVVLFSSSLQSFSALGYFSKRWFFTSGGQNIGPSASASVPMNIQGWFPLGLTGLISLLSKVLSRVFSSTTVQKHQFFGTQLSSQSNSHIRHDHWKNHSLN